MNRKHYPLGRCRLRNIKDEQLRREISKHGSAERLDHKHGGKWLYTLLPAQFKKRFYDWVKLAYYDYSYDQRGAADSKHSLNTDNAKNPPSLYL